ncbi:MAG: hypothetical protein ACLFPF_03140 [Halanaerobiales bacterium]
MLQTKAKSYYNYGYVNNKESKQNKNRTNNKSDISKTAVVLVVMSVVLIGIFFVSYICQFVQITHLTYKIDEMESNLDSINDDNYLLRIKLAEEKSMARIEKIAREDLSMVEPEQVEVVVINNDNVRKIDTLPADTNEQVFFVKVFNDFMNKIGTVKAEEID